MRPNLLDFDPSVDIYLYNMVAEKIDAGRRSFDTKPKIQWHGSKVDTIYFTPSGRASHKTSWTAIYC